MRRSCSDVNAQVCCGVLPRSWDAWGSHSGAERGSRTANSCSHFEHDLAIGNDDELNISREQSKRVFLISHKDLPLSSPLPRCELPAYLYNRPACNVQMPQHTMIRALVHYVLPVASGNSVIHMHTCVTHVFSTSNTMPWYVSCRWSCLLRSNSPSVHLHLGSGSSSSSSSRAAVTRFGRSCCAPLCRHHVMPHATHTESLPKVG